MSNNNPHSHINQTAQNSWNPLQIPSYIPRQPQLAHMSNERPMVRSPLAWHAAAPPPESLYNFMSAANHKNLEHSMNPLLPPYVRGPPPFDSMDLSLQSNRNAASPLNKSAHSLLPLPPPSQLDYGHKLQQQQHNLQQQQQAQQQQQQMLAQNNYPIHNLSTNATQSQQHGNPGMPSVSSASVTTSTPSSPAQNNAKFMSSNGSGGDCDPPASLLQQAAQNQSLNASNVNNFMRENYSKMAHLNRVYENDPHSKTLQKPVELVNKDCNYGGMLSNKMPTTQHMQQQQATKKPSPLRSGNGASGYHVSQNQQQQQSPFNSPAPTVKHNGPHTPPTPQSPNMQQASNNANNSAPSQQQQQQHQALLHAAAGNNNASLLDYNQLHLQQQHNNYTQPLHLQQQQQHLQHVYPPQHHIQQQSQHQHHQQQQQQQHWQQHQLPQHAPQMTPQSPMQPPPYNSPLHQQAQAQAQQQTQLTNLEPASPATATTSYAFEQRNAEQQQPAPPTIQSPPQRLQQPQNIPDSAESPATNASSNDDDSNGISNRPATTATTLKSKINSSKDSPPPQLNRPTVEVSPLRGSSKSPRNSPALQQRKSPRKADINSPESLDLSSKTAASPASIVAASPQRTPLTPQRQTATPTTNLNDDESCSESSANEKLKNGHTPPITQTNVNESHEPAANDEVETIDKIAEMIAKTTSNSSSQHSHQSHCSNSNDAHSNASSKSARTEHCESPKTKKQRQVLKLRNTEQHTATADWSTNSYNENATETVASKPTTTTTISSPLASNDDNAVSAGELSKDSNTRVPPQIPLTTVTVSSSSPAHHHKPPLSPQSNSRSSSSSSSSSSCSNSSRSSYGNHRAQKLKTENEVVAINLVETSANAVEHAKPLEKELKELPLNLNCKAEVKADKAASAPVSNDKSKFEEVENKLEEMFAGIEDEPAPLVEKAVYTKPQATEQVATDLSVVLELSNGLNDATNTTPTPLIATPMPIQTKAAKKSTMPSPPIKSAPTPPASVETIVEKTANDAPSPVPAAPPARKTMPRRRLSMALDPGNLRIMLEDVKKNSPKREKPKEDVTTTTTITIDDEKPSTSAAAAAAAAAALANLSSDDSSKQAKNRNNKGQKTNSMSNKSKTTTTTASKSTASTAATKRSSKSNQQKQMQTKRRRQSSSDDDFPPTTTASARDSNTTTTTTTTTSASNITEKYKSPFILVKRDGSISVVNAATAEDSSVDKQIKAKKPPMNYAHHERRNIRGFHSSTLSQKYDADTTDSTWICVFCKRGPHRLGLGDLFGPYLVTVNCEEYKNATNAPDALHLDEEFVNKRKRADMVQGNARSPPVVLATKAQEALTATIGANRNSKKKKKSLEEHPTTTTTTSILLDANDPLDTTNETFLGMNKVSENSYEVWLHEDCIVWAPDVYLVGARIMGLDAAVWNSTRYQCVLCTKSGAMVCCLQRDCKAAAHIPCARENAWKLNENDYHVHCQMHINALSNVSGKQQQQQQQQTSNLLSQEIKNS